jgi:hypothetical protein
VAYEYGWPDFRPVEHTVTQVDTKTLGAYAGVYQDSNMLFTVTREGDQLFVQLTGQPKFQLFPMSDREFFLKAVDAQIAFEVDPQGRATQLTLHQNGMDHSAQRLDDAEAKRLTDAAAAKAEAVAKRYKEQKPAPGSEAVLRRAIEELRLGQPDYSQMSLAFAGVTRQQLPSLKSNIGELGTVQSVTFKGVGPGGFDIYEVKFQNGLTEFRIGLTPDGKIEGMGFRPL